MRQQGTAMVVSTFRPGRVRNCRRLFTLALLLLTTAFASFAPHEGLLPNVHAAGLALDTTFGTGGMTITDFGGGNDQALALVIQPDSKIVAAGGDGVFRLARYNSNGTL